MNLQRFLWIALFGFALQSVIYFGLFHPLFNQNLALFISFLLYISSLIYAVFIHTPHPLAQKLSLSLGIIFVLFCSSLLSLLILGVCKVFFPPALEYQKLWASCLLILACCGIIYSIFKALIPLKLYTQTLHIPKLQTPLKILQLSDIHIGVNYLSDSKLSDIITQSNALNPDIIALTGDIIDTQSQSVLEKIQMLSKLKAKYGVFYVLGNHEYFYDVNNILDELSKIGIKTLVNENFVLEIDSKPILNIAGIADLSARAYQKLLPNLENIPLPNLKKTIQSLNPNIPSILLSHQPKVIDLLPSPSPFSLILGGHTHGGQVFPFNFLVKLEQPFVKGLYTLKDTYLYVNQGTAFWGFPMRLGSECEITLFELVGESKA